MPTLDTHPYRVLMVKYLMHYGLDEDVQNEKGFDPRADGPLKAPGQHLAKRIQRNMIAQNVAAKNQGKHIPFPRVQENGILDAPMRKGLDTLKPPDRPTFETAFLQIAHWDDVNDGSEYYTQGPKRWQGVKDVYGKVRVQTPPKLTSGDCSAGYTRWVLWSLQQNLGRVPNDIVNGAHWTGGYTGTIQAVCQHVTKPRVGDAILYPNHVTGVYSIADRTCISHGRDKAEIYDWDRHPGRYPGFWRPRYTAA